MRREILRERRPGERLDTEPVLAARFAVSVVTIRNATLLLEHEGLIERRQGSGTYVRDLRAWQHVGITLSARHLNFPAIHAFHLNMARRVWEMLEAAGERVKLYVADDDGRPPAHEELCEAADRGRLAAVVAISTLPEELARHICAGGVTLTGQDPHAAAAVSFDYDNMVRDGLRCLTEAGRRRVALIGWGAPDSHHNIGDVFAAAMVERGLAVRREWIRDQLPAFTPGAGWDAFREIWSADAEKPDGLLICDDILYRDAAMAIRELRLDVPGELMVATHFNKGTTMPHLFPATLLQFDPGAYADTLVQATLALLRGGRRPVRELMLPHRVVTAVPVAARDTQHFATNK